MLTDTFAYGVASLYVKCLFVRDSDGLAWDNSAPGYVTLPDSGALSTCCVPAIPLNYLSGSGIYKATANTSDTSSHTTYWFDAVNPAWPGWLAIGSVGEVSGGGGAPAGNGSVPVTLTLKAADGVTLLPGIDCWVCSDAAGATPIAGTLETNSLGVVSFMLDPGTNYLFRDSLSYNFPSPVILAVGSSATSITLSDGTAITTVAGVYAQQSDIENIFGIPNVIKWAILSGNDPDSSAGLAEIAARVNWAIGVATVVFENSMRQGPYALPISGPGASVWATTIVAILAGEWLYVHSRHAQRGPDGKIIFSDYEGERTWAQEQMDFARSNKIRLDAVLSGKGTNAPLVTHEGNRGAYGPGQVGYGTRALPPPGPFVS